MLEMPNQNDISEQVIIKKFQQELVPIFLETHSTWGHGTIRKEDAENILAKGLYANNAPEISTTAAGIENSAEGMKKIMNWPHRNLKYIVAIMIPKSAKMSGGTGLGFFYEHLWKAVSDKDERKLGKWKLPAKYIRGYIDVKNIKLVPNQLFEEKPEMPEPIKHEMGDPRNNIGSSQEVPKDIPQVAKKKEDTPDVW